MKKKKLSLAIAIIVGIVFFGCKKESNNSELDVKDELIRKLIMDNQLTSVMKNKRIPILKGKFCEEDDCNEEIKCSEYFKEYQDVIGVYSKEELFMQGMKEYLVIHDIDYKSKEIKYSKESFKKCKAISGVQK